MPSSAIAADLRYAFRSLRKNAAFTIVAVAALALGIGANTAIFSLARTVVLAPLPFPNADRLVQIRTVSRKTGDLGNFVSYRDILDWREQNHTLQSIAAYTFSLLDLPGGNAPLALYGARISYNLFPALGVQPTLGRNFLAAEDRPGQAQEIILSHDLWVNRFQSDPHIAGKIIRLLGRKESDEYTVVGVMPAGFNFPLTIPTSVTPPSRQMAYWIPIGVEPKRADPNEFVALTIALLRPGISVATAQADVSSVAAKLERDFPNTNLGRGVVLTSYKDQILGRSKAALLLLLGAVTVVVLITCANLANLLLSRALGRSKETGIRLALGASRWRLVQQWITESLLLSVIGGCLGLLIARLGVNLLVHLAPQGIPRIAETHLDLRALLFAAAASFLAGLFFGYLPAWCAATTHADEALSESGMRTTAHRSRVRARDLLVITEVALAVVLAIGAALLVNSFLRLTTVDPGFSRDRVLTSIVALFPPRYTDLPARVSFYRKVLDELNATPGVLSAGATDGVPLSGNLAGAYISVDGQPSAERGENRPTADIFSASPRYLQTMGIHLLRGRYLTVNDGLARNLVAIIDQFAAEKFWPNQDPLGKEISFNSANGNPIQHRVIGVVEGTRDRTIDEAPLPAIYVPMEQALAPPQMLVVHTRAEPSRMAATIRRAVAAIDKDQPVFLVTSMEDLYNNSIADRRFTAFILSILGLLATALAALGVYGVISYSAAQRTREIGIRAALGAQRLEIVTLVLSRSFILSGVGVIIGVACALVLTRFLASLLYQITPTDPWTISGVALLLIAVSLAAGYIPSYRAMKIDPVTALRHE